ncbi:hypothetical protein MAPG_10337, partial [Magnaporthiopsis poae ATCC 64411]
MCMLSRICPSYLLAASSLSPRLRPARQLPQTLTPSHLRRRVPPIHCLAHLLPPLGSSIMDPPYMATEAEDVGNPQPQHPGLVAQQPGTALPFPTDQQQSLPLPVSSMAATPVATDPHLRWPAPGGSDPVGAPYEVPNQPLSAIDPRSLPQPGVQSPQVA